MDYDPIKDRFGDAVSGGPVRYRLFLLALHLVFLRNWYVRRSLKRVMAGLDSGEPVRVLDAGTGFGQFTDYLLRRYSSVRITAVDVKPVYLQRLRRYLSWTGRAERAVIEEADLTELTLEGPFDLVMSVDVMEHIEDDRAVFRHFARVLRPGGEVIINTPSDQGGSGVGAAGDESFIGEHVRDGYVPEELSAKLLEAGLETTSVTYTYGPVGSIAWQLLVHIPMRALGASMWWLPVVGVYYLAAFPIGMLLNAIDVSLPNRVGTGLLVTAKKPVGS